MTAISSLGFLKRLLATSVLAAVGVAHATSPQPPMLDAKAFLLVDVTTMQVQSTGTNRDGGE